jgi:hypothetical protein
MMEGATEVHDSWACSGLLGVNKKINAGGMERRVAIKVGIPGDGIFASPQRKL